jgi:hypothetical protein
LAHEGVCVRAEGDRLVIRPASKLTDPMRAALREAKPELLALLAARPAPVALDLSAVAWTDADIERFNDSRARLMRWGWPEPEAEALAARLVRRDRELDPRVSCLECVSYRPGRCGNHQRAGLLTGEVGRDLAALLQRCLGFQSVR